MEENWFDAFNILNEVETERNNQIKKWGEQTHGPDRWMSILVEEVGEVARAANERFPRQYRAELIQVAAVAVAMIETLDRTGRF